MSTSHGLDSQFWLAIPPACLLRPWETGAMAQAIMSPSLTQRTWVVFPASCLIQAGNDPAQRNSFSINPSILKCIWIQSFDFFVMSDFVLMQESCTPENEFSCTKLEKGLVWALLCVSLRRESSKALVCELEAVGWGGECLEEGALFDTVALLDSWY